MQDLTPQQLLVKRFWQVTRDDLKGRGVTSDNLPYYQRRLPYADRVIIERENVRREAQTFLDSESFDLCADISGLDPQYLREQLCQ